MGGSLKRKEMLSGRFGDILSELYLLSAVLKRWEEEGRQEADLPLVDYLMAEGFLTIEQRLQEILDNFPSRPVAWLMQIFVLPFGVVRRGPSDRVRRACARILLEPSAARDRLTEGVYLGQADEAVAQLEHALELVIRTEPIRDQLKSLKIRDPKAALDKGALSLSDYEALMAAEAAVQAVVAVDDFAPEELAEAHSGRRRDEVPARRVEAAE